MARTIQSAGVEINERDLSLVASLPVGTNILVQGYSKQGPTDELVSTTSIAELQQIYGTPETAAERYFYHTAKEVLNSPGNLLTTRLPYGLSSGGGYGSEYSALLYPVVGYDGNTDEAVAVANELLSAVEVPATNATGTVANIPVSGNPAGSFTLDVSGGGYTFADDGLGSLSATSILLSEVSGTIDYATGVWAVDFAPGGNVYDTMGTLAGGTTNISGSYNYKVDTSTLYTVATSFKIGAPTQITLSEDEYTSWQAGQISWALSGNTVLTTDVSAAGQAGIIIVNELKTAVNNTNEGYYVVINDNSNIGDTTFDSATAVKYNNTDGAWTEVPTTRLEFALTGTDLTDSLSEDIETAASWNLEDPEYRDCLTIGLFKLGQTQYGQNETVSLGKNLIETHIGSLDQQRKWTPNGPEESFFLGSILNANSNYMKIFVNPNISQKSGAWVDTTSLPSKVVTRISGNSGFAMGPQIDASDSAGKAIGNLPQKLERSLRLAENRDQIPIDIVLDGGLSTVWSASRSPNAVTNGDWVGTYDAGDYLYGVFEADPDGGNANYLAEVDDGVSSRVQNNWEVIFNLFNQFCGETRKDCLFIADALRHIFVQGGEEAGNGIEMKTLDDSNKNFSQHVYRPLKNLFAASNSNYACTYGNWVKQYDNNLGDFVWLPFSGYEANIMAKMDSALQPWYAAAGLNNGIVRNIVDIAVNPTQKQRDLLYRINVNPVVFFPGDGYTVWGQKTLQRKPSAFDRINVRRLFLTLEKATNAVMRYFVFEPNTVFTRTRVVNVLTPIFEIAKNNEGVYDYLIVCDGRNNTPQVIDNNELVVDIYLKPVRIAEFILVNFIATRTDQDFNELL